MSLIGGPYVLGIDGYHGDWPIDLPKAKQNGVSFLIAKSSEGLHNIDPRYTDYRREAKTLGLIFGGYHFFDAQADGQAQAERFLKVATPVKGDIIPMLDVETYADGLVQRVNAAIAHIKAKTGKYPMLYTGDSFYQEHLSSITSCPLCIARYSSSPPVSPHVMWQYSENAREPGTPHGLDGDAFIGTHEEFMVHTL